MAFFLFRPIRVESEKIEATSTPPQTSQNAITEVVATTTEKVSLRHAVEVAFADQPAMSRVVKCESGFRQFNSDGLPLISPTSDVGVMQINQVHWKLAKSLGLDIFHSAQDNITMGRIVYKQSGLTAWSCFTNQGI